MNLIRLMFRRYRGPIAAVLALSVGSALLGVVVIAFINDRLMHAPAVMKRSILELAGLLVALFVVATGSQIAMSGLGHRLVYQVRRTMVKRVLDTGSERLAELGSARILASLQSDTSHITTAFITLPSVVYGLALSVWGFGYLAWLSPSLFLAIFAWLALTVAVGWMLLKRTHEQVTLARDTEDLLFEDYRGAIEGHKELTLNRKRAERLYEEEFDKHARANCDHEIRGDMYNGVTDNWVNTMVLGSIGLAFFLAGGLGWADTGVAATFALTVLFLRTPLTSLIGAIPHLMGGSVALAKVESLELAEYTPSFALEGADLPDDWRALHLAGVTYRYPGAPGEAGFGVGPIDLSVRRGEVVFLVGGNGSGKSTLARLLTGLNHPDGGQIRVDDRIIDEGQIAAFRRLFSTVFSDFHLFQQLLGPDGGAADEGDVKSWVDALAMTGKAIISRDRITDIRVSQGQRKRLGLLLALLERRPVLLLDEWAADQDPGYRRVFYTKLLPSLKAAGKTVIAISHDDHYFHLADRVLKMDGGRLYPWEGRLEGALAPGAARTGERFEEDRPIAALPSPVNLVHEHE